METPWEAIIGGIIVTAVIVLIGYEKIVKPNKKPTTQDATIADQQGTSYGSLFAVLGIALLLAGIITDVRFNPVIGDIVSLHKIHIKQTLYYFSGVCFIISAISFATDKIIKAISKNKNL